jgi:hypothetical protein
VAGDTGCGKSTQVGHVLYRPHVFGSCGTSDSGMYVIVVDSNTGSAQIGHMLHVMWVKGITGRRSW